MNPPPPLLPSPNQNRIRTESREKERDLTRKAIFHSSRENLLVDIKE